MLFTASFLAFIKEKYTVENNADKFACWLWAMHLLNGFGQCI